MSNLSPISFDSDEDATDAGIQSIPFDPELSQMARRTSFAVIMVLQTVLTMLFVLGRALDLCFPIVESSEDEESDDDEAFIIQQLPSLWSAAGAAKRRRVQHPLVSWYVKPRSSINWWNHYVSFVHADDARFREVFRLPLALFEEVCSLVRDDLRQGRIPVFLLNVPGRVFSVERKVAIAILRLSSGMRCIDVSEHFGCGRSTVSKIVVDFASSLGRNGRHLLQWPQTESKLTEVKEGFKALHSFPNCCGAIDLCSLPKIVNACCILHNILIDHDVEEIEPMQQVDLNDPLVDNPDIHYFDWEDDIFMDTQRREGELVRNNLMEYANLMREDNDD